MVRLDFTGSPEFSARELPALEMVLVTHPAHPLARADGLRTRAELAPYVELVVPDSGDAPVPHRLSLGANHVLTLSDFHAKREALVMGVGFGWLPRHLCEADLARRALVAVPFVEGGTFRLSAHLVQRGDVPLGRGASRLVEMLLEEVGVVSA